MKKLFTIFCAGLITFGLSAQTDAGQMYLDANVSSLDYSSLKVTKITVDGEDLDSDALPEDATNSFTFGATAGYFVIDGLLAGATISMENEKTGDVKDNTFMFAPMVRYYISDMGIFAEASYGFGTNTSNPGAGDDSKLSLSGLSIGAGYAISLADNVHLNPKFSYNMMGSKQNDASTGDVDVKTKMSGISIGASLSITM